MGEHRHISEIEIGTQPSVVDTETMAMDTDIMTVVRVGRDQNIAGPDTRLTFGVDIHNTLGPRVSGAVDTITLTLSPQPPSPPTASAPVPDKFQQT